MSVRRPKRFLGASASLAGAKKAAHRGAISRKLLGVLGVLVLQAVLVVGVGGWLRGRGEGGVLAGLSGGGAARAAGVSVWVSDGALLRNPRGIVFDDLGDAFVAVQGTDAVTKVTAAGVVSAYATGLQNPWGVALDGAGNLFVTLVNKKELWKIAPDGSRTLVASGLKNMHQLAFNPADGLLYVTREDGVSTVNPATGAVNALWETPYPNGADNCWGIALDGSGGFYVAMKLSRNEWLFHVTPDGQGGLNTTTVETDGNKIPRSLAVDAMGNLYAGDNKKQLWLYPGGQGPGQLLSENELKQPFGLAVHPHNGDLYVTESTMERIAIWDLSFDGSGPVVSVTAPASGALTSDNTPAIAVSYSDADSGVKTSTLNVQVDGVDVTGQLTIAAGEAAGALGAPLTNGSHTLTARIENLYGIPTVATSVFTVDGAAPTLSVASPAEGQTLGVNTVSVTGQADDMGGSGVASVSVNGQALVLAGTNFTGQVALNEGVNTLSITATDAAGNTTQATRTVTYTPPDVTPPVLALVSPMAGQTFSANTVAIAATATDDRGLNAASVTLTLDGAAVPATLNPPNITATASDLSDGPHTLTLSAQDNAGNGAASATVTFTTDNTAPALSVTTPAEGATLSVNTTTLTGVVSDAVGPVTVTLNGVSIPLYTDPNQPPSGLQSPASSLFSQALTLAEGANVYTLTATDGAGHASTQVRTITYTPPQEEEEEPPPAQDATPPVLTLTSHPADAVLSGASVTLSGVAADDVALGSLALNGQPVVLTAGSFSHALTLAEGANVLTLVLTDAAGNATTLIRTLTYTPPAPPQEEEQEGENGEPPVPPGVVENPPPVEPPVVQPPPVETPVVENPPAVEAPAPVVENPPATETPLPVVEAPPLTQPPPAEAPVPVAQNPPAQQPPATGGETSPPPQEETPVPPATVQDTTPPVITLQSPAQISFTTTGTTVTLEGVVSDDSGGAVALSLNGVTLAVSPGGGFSSLLALVPGPNVLALLATDQSGNVATTTLNVTRETPVDNTPPLLTITQPPSDPFWLNTLSYVLEGTTEAGASVSVDGQMVVTMPTGQGGATFTQILTLTEGNNTFLVSATDAAGNETSKLVEIIADTQPPLVTWENPTAQGYFDAQSPVLVRVAEPVGNTGSGINPAAMHLTADGQPLALTQESPGIFTAPAPASFFSSTNNPNHSPSSLQSPASSLLLTAADNAGNTAVATVVADLGQPAPEEEAPVQTAGTFSPQASFPSEPAPPGPWMHGAKFAELLLARPVTQAAALSAPRLQKKKGAITRRVAASSSGAGGALTLMGAPLPPPPPVSYPPPVFLFQNASRPGQRTLGSGDNLMVGLLFAQTVNDPTVTVNLLNLSGVPEDAAGALVATLTLNRDPQGQYLGLFQFTGQTDGAGRPVTGLVAQLQDYETVTCTPDCVGQGERARYSPPLFAHAVVPEIASVQAFATAHSQSLVVQAGEEVQLRVQATPGYGAIKAWLVNGTAQGFLGTVGEPITLAENPLFPGLYYATQNVPAGPDNQGNPLQMLGVVASVAGFTQGAEIGADSLFTMQGSTPLTLVSAVNQSRNTGAWRPGDVLLVSASGQQGLGGVSAQLASVTPLTTVSLTSAFSPGLVGMVQTLSETFPGVYEGQLVVTQTTDHQGGGLESLRVLVWDNATADVRVFSGQRYVYEEAQGLASVLARNLTRPGVMEIAQGEQYELEATGAPGLGGVVGAMKNAESLALPAEKQLVGGVSVLSEASPGLYRSTAQGLSTLSDGVGVVARSLAPVATDGGETLLALGSGQTSAAFAGGQFFADDFTGANPQEKWQIIQPLEPGESLTPQATGLGVSRSGVGELTLGGYNTMSPASQTVELSGAFALEQFTGAGALQWALGRDDIGGQKLVLEVAWQSQTGQDMDAVVSLRQGGNVLATGNTTLPLGAPVDWSLTYEDQTASGGPPQGQASLTLSPQGGTPMPLTSPVSGFPAGNYSVNVTVQGEADLRLTRLGTNLNDGQQAFTPVAFAWKGLGYDQPLRGNEAGQVATLFANDARQYALSGQPQGVAVRRHLGQRVDALLLRLNPSPDTTGAFKRLTVYTDLLASPESGGVESLLGVMAAKLASEGFPQVRLQVDKVLTGVLTSQGQGNDYLWSAPSTSAPAKLAERHVRGEALTVVEIPPDLESASLSKASDPQATVVAVGDQLRITAQGQPGFGDVAAVLVNPASLQNNAAGAALSGVLSLSETTPGQYAATLSLSSAVDAAGQTASQVQAAVKRFSPPGGGGGGGPVLGVAAGYDDPGVLAFSPDPTPPPALADDFTGTALDNTRWQASADGGTTSPPPVLDDVNNRVVFRVQDNQGQTRLQSTRQDYTAPTGSLAELTATLLFPSSASPQTGQSLNTFLTLPGGCGGCNVAGFALRVAGPGQPGQLQAVLNVGGDVRYTNLPGVSVPADTPVSVKVSYQSNPAQVMYWVDQGAGFVLQHTETGFTPVAASNLGTLILATGQGGPPGPAGEFHLLGVGGNLTPPGRDYTVSLTPLSKDGVGYDSLAVFGIPQPGLLFGEVGPNLTPVTASNTRVAASPTLPVNGALLRLAPAGGGADVRATLFTQSDEATLLANLQPPPGFSSIQLDAFASALFIPPAAPGQSFSWNPAALQPPADPNTPTPAPGSPQPLLAQSGGSYFLSGAYYQYQNQTWNNTPGWGVVGSLWAFSFQGSISTIALQGSPGGDVQATLNPNQPVNLFLYQYGQDHLTVFTQLSQATLAQIPGLESPVFAQTGVFTPPVSPGDPFTYHAPQTPVANPLTAFFQSGPTPLLTNTLGIQPAAPQAVLSKLGDPQATVVAVGDTLQVRVQGPSGETNVKAALFNPATGPNPNGALVPSLLALTEAPPGSGQYTATAPLTTAQDQGGATATQVKAAVGVLTPSGGTGPVLAAGSPAPALAQPQGGGNYRLNSAWYALNGQTYNQLPGGGEGVAFIYNSGGFAFTLIPAGTDADIASLPTFNPAQPLNGFLINPGFRVTVYTQLNEAALVALLGLPGVDAALPGVLSPPVTPGDPFTYNPPAPSGGGNPLAEFFNLSSSLLMTNTLSIAPGQTDTTPPVVVLNAPVPGQHLNASSVATTGSVTDAPPGSDVNGGSLALQVTDASGSVVIGPLGAAAIGYNAANGSFSTSLEGLGEGVYTLTLSASDNAANAAAASTTFTVDRTAPSVSILSPNFNAQWGGTEHSVTVRVTDNFALLATPAGQNTLVEVLVAGQVVGQRLSLAATDCQPGGQDCTLTVAVNTANLPAGTQPMLVRASDPAGNQGSAASQLRLSNNVAPIVTITYPPDGTTVQGAFALLANVATPQGQVRYIDLFVDGAATPAATVEWTPTQVSGSAALTVDTALLSPGPHTFTVKAYRTPGRSSRVGEAAVTLTVQDGPVQGPDAMPPGVEIVSPGPDEVLRGVSQSFTIRVSDDRSLLSGSTSLAVSFTGRVVATVNGFNPQDCNAQGTVCLLHTHAVITNLPDADPARNDNVPLTATATDAAGNTNSASVLVAVRNNVGPDVMILSPTTSSEISGVTTVQAQFDAPVLLGQNVRYVDLFVDGSTTPAATADLGNPGALSATVQLNLNTTALADGPHTLRVVAYLKPGRSTKRGEDSVAVMVNNSSPPGKDTTSPTIIILSPTPGKILRGTDQVVTLELGDDRSLLLSPGAQLEISLGGKIVHQTFGFSQEQCPQAGASCTFSTSINIANVPDQNPDQNDGLSLSVSLKDPAGNTGTASISVSTENNIGPLVTILSPPANSLISGSFVLSASFEDSQSKIKLVDLYLNNNPVPFASMPVTPAAANGQISFSVNAEALAPGFHQFRVRAYRKLDRTGRAGESTIALIHPVALFNVSLERWGKPNETLVRKGHLLKVTATGPPGQTGVAAILANPDHPEGLNPGAGVGAAFPLLESLAGLYIGDTELSVLEDLSGSILQKIYAAAGTVPGPTSPLGAVSDAIYPGMLVYSPLSGSGPVGQEKDHLLAWTPLTYNEVPYDNLGVAGSANRGTLYLASDGSQTVIENPEFFYRIRLGNSSGGVNAALASFRSLEDTVEHVTLYTQMDRTLLEQSLEGAFPSYVERRIDFFQESMFEVSGSEGAFAWNEEPFPSLAKINAAFLSQDYLLTSNRLDIDNREKIAPLVTVDAPGLGAAFSTSMVIVRGSLVDSGEEPSGLNPDSLSVSVVTVIGESVVAGPFDKEGAALSLSADVNTGEISFSIEGLPEGAYYLVVRIQDNSDNETIFKQPFVIDFTPPEIFYADGQPHAVPVVANTPHPIFDFSLPAQVQGGNLDIGVTTFSDSVVIAGKLVPENGLEYVFPTTGGFPNYTISGGTPQPIEFDAEGNFAVEVSSSQSTYLVSFFLGEQQVDGQTVGAANAFFRINQGALTQIPPTAIGLPEGEPFFAHTSTILHPTKGDTAEVPVKLIDPGEIKAIYLDGQPLSVPEDGELRLTFEALPTGLSSHLLILIDHAGNISVTTILINSDQSGESSGGFGNDIAYLQILSPQPLPPEKELIKTASPSVEIQGLVANVEAVIHINDVTASVFADPNGSGKGAFVFAYPPQEGLNHVRVSASLYVDGSEGTTLVEVDSVNLEILADFTPPTVNWINPGDDNRFDPYTEVELQAFDPGGTSGTGIGRFFLKIDGQNIPSSRGINGITYFAPALTPSFTPKPFEVYLEDNVGNTQVVQRDILVIDNRPPGFGLIDPSAISLDTDATDYVIRLATEPGATVTVGEPGNESPISTDENGWFDYPVSLSLGENVFRFRAVDAWENESVLVMTLNRLLPPPTLTVSTPTSGQIFQENETISISGTSDPGAVVGVGTQQTTAQPDGSFSFSIPAIYGVNRLDIYARMEGHMPNQVAVPISVQDQIPPTVVFLTPADGSIFNEKTPILVEVQTEPQSTVLINGQKALSVAGSHDRYQVTLLGQGTGALPITAEVVDKAGNTGSGTISVTRVVPQLAQNLQLAFANPPESGQNTAASSILVKVDVVNGRSELAAIWVNGQATLEEADGTFSVVVPLSVGSNTLEAIGQEQSGRQVAVTTAITRTQVATSPGDFVFLLNSPSGEDEFADGQVIDLQGDLDPGASLMLNGVPVARQSGVATFAVQVPLGPGANKFTLSATKDGITKTLDFFATTEPKITVTVHSPAKGEENVSSLPHMTFSIQESDGIDATKAVLTLNGVGIKSWTNPTTQLAHQVSAALPDGEATYKLQVFAPAALTGYPERAYTVEGNFYVNQPKPSIGLTLNQPPESASFYEGEPIPVEGVITTVGQAQLPASVEVEGNTLQVQPDGTFSGTVKYGRAGSKEITVRASSRERTTETLEATRGVSVVEDTAGTSGFVSAAEYQERFDNAPEVEGYDNCRVIQNSEAKNITMCRLSIVIKHHLAHHSDPGIQYKLGIALIGEDINKNSGKTPGWTLQGEGEDFGEDGEITDYSDDKGRSLIIMKLLKKGNGPLPMFRLQVDCTNLPPSFLERVHFVLEDENRVSGIGSENGSCGDIGDFINFSEQDLAQKPSRNKLRMHLFFHGVDRSGYVDVRRRLAGQENIYTFFLPGSDDTSFDGKGNWENTKITMAYDQYNLLFDISLTEAQMRYFNKNVIQLSIPDGGAFPSIIDIKKNFGLSQCRGLFNGPSYAVKTQFVEPIIQEAQNNNLINIDDLLVISNHFGETGVSCGLSDRECPDLNSDGIVNSDDVKLALYNQLKVGDNLNQESRICELGHAYDPSASGNRDPMKFFSILSGPKNNGDVISDVTSETTLTVSANDYLNVRIGSGNNLLIKLNKEGHGQYSRKVFFSLGKYKSIHYELTSLSGRTARKHVYDVERVAPFFYSKSEAGEKKWRAYYTTGLNALNQGQKISLLENDSECNEYDPTPVMTETESSDKKYYSVYQCYEGDDKKINWSIVLNKPLSNERARIFGIASDIELLRIKQVLENKVLFYSVQNGIKKFFLYRADAPVYNRVTELFPGLTGLTDILFDTTGKHIFGFFLQNQGSYGTAVKKYVMEQVLSGDISPVKSIASTPKALKALASKSSLHYVYNIDGQQAIPDRPISGKKYNESTVNFDLNLQHSSHQLGHFLKNYALIFGSNKFYGFSIIPNTEIYPMNNLEVYNYGDWKSADPNHLYADEFSKSLLEIQPGQAVQGLSH